MGNKAKKDGRKWLENIKKINAPFGDTLCSWNVNFFIFWARVTDASQNKYTKTTIITNAFWNLFTVLYISSFLATKLFENIFTSDQNLSRSNLENFA